MNGIRMTTSHSGATAIAMAVLLTLGLLVVPGAVSTASADSQYDSWSFPDGYAADEDPASMHRAASGIRATRLWNRGITGQGIDVALIDTGVRPTPVLSRDALLAGPSFAAPEAERPSGPPYGRRDTLPESLRDPDGHGTHLAAIIAGSSGGPETYGDRTAFTGIAPDARIVSVRVGQEDGNASLDQVVSAIEWVIENRNTDGRNIRVLNLSLAADPADSPTDDILAHAVTLAWDAGIVVVAAAGNDGGGHRLASPAYEPRIISVGALDHADSTKAGDAQPDPSSSGTTRGRERPDIWAPGRSIPSAIALGSAVADNAEAVRLGDTLVRGSGTSQATAVVSGAAALVLSAHPELTPDEVAGLLHAGAEPIEVDGEDVPNARLDLDESLDDVDDDDDIRRDTSPITRIVAGYSAADPDTWNLGGGEDVHAGDPEYVGARWVGARWVGARWVGARWVGARWVMEGWE
ncbi:alkaline serine protease [Euzebya pacifica]|uniref:Alkaline serine protease n=2 Tax=Euzebya pacifica TaxID=1608957 RepID=A0A346Y3I3_9ACTN|nr:alkaline serine protease [Euzebya pacifica]